jgi:hypothetical protein
MAQLFVRRYSVIGETLRRQLETANVECDNLTGGAIAFPCPNIFAIRSISFCALCPIIALGRSYAFYDFFSTSRNRGTELWSL